MRAAQAGVDRGETVSADHPGAGERRTASRRRCIDGRKPNWRPRARNWIQAEQATDVARATVAQFVGTDPAHIAIAAPGLQQLPPERSTAATGYRRRIPWRASKAPSSNRPKPNFARLERAYFPRFYLQGAAYARGTGAETDGRLLGGLNGLAPNVQDYALGFTVSFPVIDLPAIQAREAAQSANVRAQTARSPSRSPPICARSGISPSPPLRAHAGSPPIRRSRSRRRARPPSRPPPATSPAWAISMRWRKRSACSRKPKSTMPWRAWASGAGCWQWPTAAGDIRPFVAEVGQ